MAGSAPLLRDAGLSNAVPAYPVPVQYVLTAGTGVNVATLRAPQLSLSHAVGMGTGSALASLTQTLCDQAMGEVGGIVATTVFGTTAMVDNDTAGGVIGLNGQVAELGVCSVTCNIAGTLTVFVATPTRTALTNAPFTGLQVYISPAGNIAWRLTLTNISAAATAGHILLNFPLFIK